MQPGQVFGGGLGDGVEERVPAAHVGLERVLHPDAVAELHVMVVARRPQLVLSVPGERNAQKTQCSMWNIGIC